MIYLAKNHITSEDGISFNFGTNWDILHAHDYWEFILIVEPVTHIINNHHQQTNTQDVLIVRPNIDYHKFISSHSPISSFNIKIRDDVFHNITDSYQTDLYCSFFTKPTPILFQLDSLKYNTIYKTCLSALNTTENYSLFLKICVQTILIDYIYQKNSTMNYSIITQRIIEKITNWKNYQQKLPQILKDIDISYMQMYRIFKSETGYTIKDLFFDSKMKYASSLLISSQYSIAQIAQIVGYDTQSHFGKVFKEAFGISPYSYRKNGISASPVHTKFSVDV